ncbi:MAG: hypothetical protein AB1489_00815, partial [Acidobacteriota bacterium]
AELLEELRLNESFLHQIMGAPRPKYKVFFFTECSVDSRYLASLEREGVRALIFPHLDSEKMHYQVSDSEYDYVHRAFRIGNHMVALPRHFPVSQEIWRPITRWHHEGVRNQGFLIGEYAVFDSEYRNDQYLSFPIDKQQAIAEYTEVLRQAITAAPDGGLILYIQDLELMDFGDAAFQILAAAWPQVIKELVNEIEIQFVSPDQYLDLTFGGQLPDAYVKFQRASWAPEIRVLLRSDGHYPPLGTGNYKGVNIVEQVFKRYPFIYWDTGRFLTEPFDWILESFGYSLLTNINSKVLSDLNYELQRLPPEKQLPLHLRLMKRACNWGWQVDEGRAKWPYLHGIQIAELLQLQLQLYPLLRPKPRRPLDETLFTGLERVLEGFLDTRIGYLTFGLSRQQDERGIDIDAGLKQLAYARDLRERAASAARSAQALHTKLLEKPHDRLSWQQFIEQMKEYCLFVFLCYDHLQQTWGTSPDTNFLVQAMYRYLYDIYPPKFPQIFDDLQASEKVVARSQAVK